MLLFYFYRPRLLDTTLGAIDSSLAVSLVFFLNYPFDAPQKLVLRIHNSESYC